MKKVVVSSLVSLFILSCSVPVANNSTQNDPVLSPFTSHLSPVKEDFTALAKKYNFAELEKEYKSFSTKALADTYVKKMFNKFLIVTPNSVQVIRQVEFSRYLKNNGDTSYETSLKNIFSDTPLLYSTLTGMTAVQTKMTSESGTFGFYILGVSPNQTVPTALPATNITETSFTANWTAVTGATSYILIVNGVEITNITGTNHSVPGLQFGTSNTYKVKAIVSGVPGNESNQITVKTILPAPVLGAATSIGQNTLTANWNAVIGVTSYTLLINGTEYSGLTATTKEVNGLAPGTLYPYYVKAVNTVTESVNSGILNTVTVPANPTAGSPTGITSSGFTANWSSVTSATGYKLTVDGAETDVGLVTSIGFTGLPSGSGHTYSVKAYNTSGTSNSSNTENVLLSPVVLNLDAGNMASYPGSGTTWNDLSGDGNNGTLVNGVGYSYINGGMLLLDGVNDYVSIPDSESFNLGSNNFTVDGWVYLNALNARGQGWMVQWHNNFSWYFGTSDVPLNNTFVFAWTTDGTFNTGTIASSDVRVTPGEWHYYTATRIGNTLYLYVDGVLKKTNPISGSIFNASTDVIIGDNFDVPDSFMLNGNISNIKLYKGKGLSSAEVLQNYNATKSKFTVPSGFVSVKGGTFQMGGNTVDELPVHSVTLSNYYIAEKEVTQGEWATVYNAVTTTSDLRTRMGSEYPSYYTVSDRANHPVEKITWWKAIAFCNAKSLKDGFPVAYNLATGAFLKADGVTETTDTTQVEGYRLPTEAEWEYAARGGNGNTTNGNIYSGSNNASLVAVINASETSIVGTKSPNELGIHDMSGNVWEMVQDYYASYTGDINTSVQNPYISSGSDRVERGGSCGSSASGVRSARRSHDYPSHSANDIGFRVCRTAT